MLALACGSEDTVKDKLVGSWVAELNASEAVAYTFNDDGTFEIDLFSISGADVQMEALVGSFELRDGANGLADDDGAYLFCLASHSTCNTPWRAGYSFDFVGETLRLVNDDGAILLQPIAKGEAAGSGVVTFGCFDDTGFYSSSLSSMECEPGDIRACAIAGQTCEGIQTCDAVASVYGACVCP